MCLRCWLISKVLASKSSTKWDQFLDTVETGIKRSGKQSPFISSAHNYTKIYTWTELSIRSGRTTIITIIETEGGRRKIKKKEAKQGESDFTFYARMLKRRLWWLCWRHQHCCYCLSFEPTMVLINNNMLTRCLSLGLNIILK